MLKSKRELENDKKTLGKGHMNKTICALAAHLNFNRFLF